MAAQMVLPLGKQVLKSLSFQAYPLANKKGRRMSKVFSYLYCSLRSVYSPEDPQLRHDFN